MIIGCDIPVCDNVFLDIWSYEQIYLLSLDQCIKDLGREAGCQTTRSFEQVLDGETIGYVLMHLMLMKLCPE